MTLEFHEKVGPVFPDPVRDRQAVDRLIIPDPDEHTGFVMDTKELSDIINHVIIERFDHKNLNLDVEDFKVLNPTAENIAYVFYNLLKEQIPSSHKLKIKLYETPRNYVEYPA